MQANRRKLEGRFKIFYLFQNIHQLTNPENKTISKVLTVFLDFIFLSFYSPTGSEKKQTRENEGATGEQFRQNLQCLGWGQRLLNESKGASWQSNMMLKQASSSVSNLQWGILHCVTYLVATLGGGPPQTAPSFWRNMNVLAGWHLAKLVIYCQHVSISISVFLLLTSEHVAQVGCRELVLPWV